MLEQRQPILCDEAAKDGPPDSWGLFGSVGGGDALKGYGSFEGCFLFFDHGGYVGEEFLVVVDDAVFYGVFDSADALDFAGFVVEAHPAGGVEDFEIGQGVLVEEDEVGALAGTDDSEVYVGLFGALEL